MHLFNKFTAWQSGGWVPKASRSFHYWQPGSYMETTPIAGNPAMSPMQKGEKQAPITLIKQWKDKGGTREGK